MINTYIIDKENNDVTNKLANNYLKLISKQTRITENYIFNKDIVKAQKNSSELAKKSYTIALDKYIEPNSFNIILDESGKDLSSEEFAEVLVHPKINFFIGGAFGFEKEFLKRANLKLSMSKMTFTHTMAKLFLYEQIYRGFCIQNNHPYHKV
ncbi:MAG: Ribosomal RNA large subunit methyltransferase H [uncultured Campylobacterales bacterium]|uniref:Ribosomal RNA large subunit methyltransferase H n=1 Tax=uncultured Campylobacterales bacterium TaxID=352960 RepID=A0A6S6RYD4_9BACT|nr:MAG: Ribosomal RNA large subunit methyltransferase H [uncultured Campylobacterales bacterium]